VIAPYLPADGVSGGCTQLASLLRALAPGRDVDYVCYDLPLMDARGRASAARVLKKCARQAVVVPFHGRWRDNRLTLRPEDLPVYFTPEMKAAVARLSRHGHDVVQIEFECMAPFGRFARGEKKFVTVHELNALMRWRRACRGPLRKRPFHAVEALRSLAWDLSNLRGFDAIFTFNPVEARLLRLVFPRTRVEALPIAVNSQIPTPKSQVVFDMVFLGNFAHLPNADALTFALSGILPRLPGRTLLVVGEGLDPAAEQRCKTIPGVTLAGQSGDPRRHLRSARVAIAPMRLGGGARLKVVEALAAGVPVVATPVGAEGIRVAPEEGLIVRKTGAALAAAVEQLLGDPKAAARLGASGREAVQRNHSVEALGDSITRAWAVRGVGCEARGVRRSQTRIGRRLDATRLRWSAVFGRPLVKQYAASENGMEARPGSKTGGRPPNRQVCRKVGLVPST